MKVLAVTIFVLLVVTGFAEEEDCDVNRVLDCADHVLNVDTDDSEGAAAALCAGTQRSFECLQDFVTDCVDEEERNEFQSELDEMQESVNTACQGISDDDEDSEDLACLDNIEEDTVKCAEDALGDILVLALTENYSENKIKCVAYSKITKCVVKKVKANCGDHVGALFAAALDEATPVEIEEACEESGTALKRK